ncbi:MAG TPA: hypothetical protein VGD80_27130 [Kofleriaceae bacterium]
MARPAPAALLAAIAAFGCSAADPREPAAPAGVVVTVTTGAPPALIAFRDEATVNWQSLAPTATTFDITMTGPYEVVVVCELPGDKSSISVSVTQYARTLDDERTIKESCATAQYPFTVVGQMAESGQVSLGDYGSGSRRATSTWDFEFRARLGTFDLVALFGDSTRAFTDIAIRRGVTVSGNTDLGLIERSKERLYPLVPATFTATNPRPGESLSGSVSFTTGSTGATLTSRVDPTAPSAWITTLIPQSALASTDRQRIRLSGSAVSSDAMPQGNFRTVTHDVQVGDPMSVTLPEPMGRATFEMSTFRLLATWSTVPEYDTLMLSRNGDGNGPVLGIAHAIVLSRRFVEATGSTSVALDLRDVPGFKSEWHPDPSSDQGLSLIARRGSSPGEVATSSVSEVISTTAAVRSTPLP